MEWLIAASFGIAVLILVVRWSMKAANSGRTRKYLAGFNEQTAIGSFRETVPAVHFTGPKVKHMVLLFHGYSDSPYTFRGLAEQLKLENIGYYAPLFTGFGLNDMRLLSKIRCEDWLRDALLAYDLVKCFAEKVSIVGHSNGGVLALYVAGQREVEHLILSGPNVIAAKSDLKYKKLLNTPVISHFFQWLIPVFIKPMRGGRTLEHGAAIHSFHYPALPIQSLKALWDVQDRLDITKANMKTLTVLYGEHDRSVDIQAMLSLLDDNGIPYEKKSFLRSGHNILEDYDRKEVIQAICKALIQSKE